MLTEYLPVLLFIVIAVGLACAIVILGNIFGSKFSDPEKSSPYECGFEPFDNARQKIDVRFYLVAILFIIFDLEIAFLFPWSVVFKNLPWSATWAMMGFLGLLVVGFIYEWKKGALEWE